MIKYFIFIALTCSALVYANEEKEMVFVSLDQISIQEDGIYLQIDDSIIKVSALFHIAPDVYVAWKCEFCKSTKTVDDCDGCMQMLRNARTYQDFIDKLHHDEPLYNSRHQDKELG